MNDLDLDVAFNINEAEVEAATRNTRERIRSVGEAARASGAVATRSFNGLQNSINQISRELPAFTYSAQTGLMAVANNFPIIVDEINRVIIANRTLTASGQAAVPVWRQVISSLFSWGTALSVGITLLTVYGKEVGNFVASLFKGKEAINAAKLSIEQMNKALSGTEFSKAIESTSRLRNEIDLAKEGFLSKKDVLADYNKELGGTLGYATGLDEAEKNLVKNGQAYIQMTLLKAKATLELKSAAEKAAASETEKLKTDAESANWWDKFKAGMSENSIEFDPQAFAKQDAEIKRAGAKRKAAIIKQNEDERKVFEDLAKKDMLEAAKIAQAAGLNYFEDKTNPQKAASDFANMVKSRQDLLNKISDLDAEYSRKSFTKDEEEIQALKDKFAEFRRIIAEENNKIRKYNETHKNKIGLIDAGQIAPIEDRATTDLVYRQATEKLKTSLDKQKELYRDYEQYKTSFGETAAVQRYGKEFDTAKTYLQVLGEEYAKLTAAQSKGTLTGPQQERLKLVKTAIDAEQKLTEDNFVKLLADLQGYESKRIALQENALAKVEDLRKKGYGKEAENQRVKSEAELTELDKQHVQHLKSYTDLFDNIDRLSTGALRKGIANLQKEVNQLTLSPKAKEFFDKLFADLNGRAESQAANDFKNIASSLGESARYAGALDENLGQALSVAANLAGQVGNIKQGIADFKSSTGKGDIFGQIASGLGIFGSVLGIFSGIASLFDHSKEEAAKMQAIQEQQVLATQANTKALERSLGLIKEVYGTDRLLAYKKGLDEITASQEKANKALEGRLFNFGDPYVDDIINKLNNGEKVAFPLTNESMERLRASNSIDGKSLKELQELLDKDLFDARTAAIVQSLIDLEQQAKATRNALTEEVTGINFDSLTEKIRAVFDSGEPLAKNFADVIETSIRGAFSNAFKRKEIEERMQPLFDALYKAGDDGTFTTDEIKTLRDMRDKIAKELEERAKAYEQIIGPATDSSSGNTNSLQGAYKTASQASIDLLSANTGGLRIATVEGNNLIKAGNATMADGLTEIKKHTLSLMEIAVNTKVTADYAPYLKHLESMDKKMDNNGDYLIGTGRGNT